MKRTWSCEQGAGLWEVRCCREKRVLCADDRVALDEWGVFLVFGAVSAANAGLGCFRLGS
jgi:hypothetical protein